MSLSFTNDSPSYLGPDSHPQGAATPRGAEPTDLHPIAGSIGTSVAGADESVGVPGNAAPPLTAALHRPPPADERHRADPAAPPTQEAAGGDAAGENAPEDGAADGTADDGGTWDPYNIPATAPTEDYQGPTLVEMNRTRANEYFIDVLQARATRATTLERGTALLALLRDMTGDQALAAKYPIDGAPVDDARSAQLVKRTSDLQKQIHQDYRLLEQWERKG